MTAILSPDAKYKTGSSYWFPGKKYGNLGVNCHDFARDFMSISRQRHPSTGQC
jgi:hypothetical protein